MGLRSFASSVVRLFKLSKKPGRTELMLSVKICLLGVILIGLLGFIIKMVALFTLGAVWWLVL